MYRGEITFRVRGLTNGGTWRVTAQIDPRDNIRWAWVNDACRLTAGFARVEIQGEGNGDAHDSFRTPKPPDQFSLAWGHYRFTWDLPQGYEDVEFDLDLRDADWAQGYAPRSPDLIILLNAQNYRLQWCVADSPKFKDLTGNIWDAWGRRVPNQQPFQPTQPVGFVCINGGRAGENPVFEWYSPAQPTDLLEWPNCFFYNIYRSENKGQGLSAAWLLGFSSRLGQPHRSPGPTAAS